MTSTLMPGQLSETPTICGFSSKIGIERSTVNKNIPRNNTNVFPLSKDVETSRFTGTRCSHQGCESAWLHIPVHVVEELQGATCNWDVIIHSFPSKRFSIRECIPVGSPVNAEQFDDERRTYEFRFVFIPSMARIFSCFSSSAFWILRVFSTSFSFFVSGVFFAKKPTPPPPTYFCPRISLATFRG